MQEGTTTIITIAEFIRVKSAYSLLRMALCDIEGGVADTLEVAKMIASKAISMTPPTV